MLVSGSALWLWLRRLGGPGLILIGIVDGSPLPLPGSTDALLIILAGNHGNWWPYYALMATVGAVIGGYLTYQIAEKGEEKTIEKKIGRRKAKKLYDRFKGHGFATVVTGAVLPPPFPLFPVILTAGALQYPRKNFLMALILGRGARYFALAFLAHLYGRALLRMFSQYYQPLLYALIGLVVCGAVGALLYFKWYRPRRQNPQHA
jgi:membrane protein YqaA with SNARE-associated domain